MTLEFTVIAEPIPKGSTKAFIPKGWNRPVITNANPRTKAWQALVAEAAGRALQIASLEDRLVTTMAVRVDIVFYLPRPKSLPKSTLAHLKAPDVDKLARAVLDALTHVCWRDDSQVVGLFVSKAYAGVNDSPRAWIRVTSVAGLEPIVLPKDQPLFAEVGR